jgi:hypothetical protein
MKINVFGKLIEVVRKDNSWDIFYLGTDGKKRSVNDIVIPADLKEEELTEYLSDLCHEWATPVNKEVKILDS